MAKLEKVWLVRTPRIGFEPEDVLCELSIKELVAVIRGTPNGAWEHENTKLYTDKKSAEQDADARTVKHRLSRIGVLQERKAGCYD